MAEDDSISFKLDDQMFRRIFAAPQADETILNLSVAVGGGKQHQNKERYSHFDSWAVLADILLRGRNSYDLHTVLLWLTQGVGLLNGLCPGLISGRPYGISDASTITEMISVSLSAASTLALCSATPNSR